MMALIGALLVSPSARLCAVAAAARLVSMMTLPSAVVTRKVLLAGTATVRSPPVPTATPIASKMPFPRSRTRTCCAGAGVTEAAATAVRAISKRRDMRRLLEIELADDGLHEGAARRAVGR